MLKLEHISKTYPGVTALDDVSLEFERGEVHALLGENGAGKSTLIKIIAGAIEPDAGGVIDFDGSQFERMTPALSAKCGVTVIYISHRMDEVFQITERISVLRDGRLINTLPTASTNRPELVSLMVGRELTESFPARKTKPGEVVLEARDLTGNSVEHVSFKLHRGEILGFAGLVGSGRSETMELVSGAKHLEHGEILIHGKKAHITSPNAAIRHGIELMPEDRKELGVILHNTVMFNTSLSCMGKLTRLGFINGRRNREVAEKYRADLSIKVPGIKQMVVNLSGGNQQKVVLAKALAADPEIIIFDEPTKGIDVGAKQEIYQLMNTLAEAGKAIIMISSDMEEILGMSDRIVVLHEGLVAGELQRDEFSQERVLQLASGM